MWATDLQSEAIDGPRPRRTAQFVKTVILWVPRRFLTPNGVDVKAFVSDVNEKVLHHGFVLSDGQVLSTPLTDVIHEGVLRPEVVNVDGHTFQKPIRAGDYTEVILERNFGDGVFAVPAKRDWRKPQQDFFGFENPYQMADEAGEYTSSHLATRVFGPYLSPEERIAAVIHGVKDSYYFYCTCHQAEVVYTTRHRLVCMGCGATHIVIRNALELHPKRLLTPEDWIEFFDEDGALRDEEIGLSVVDFQDIESVDTVWATDQWMEAKERFVFFARSSPEEVRVATRGTEADPSILMEAGFTPVDISPPIAHQLADDSINVSLIENAAHALCDGVASFLSGRTNSDRLVNAIPQLFRALELLLKAKLQEVDPNGLVDQPNNPTVLKRLRACGVALTSEEGDTVGRLRRLRNDLQHGTAKFNYRNALAVSRKTIVLLDRFAHLELGLWIGDVIPQDLWHQLLAINEIVATAEHVVHTRLERARQHAEAVVSMCDRCGRNAMMRPHPKTGASCVFCHYVPVTPVDF